MAELAFGLAGAGLATLGALGGGPAGAQLGFAIGALIGGLLFPPEGPTIDNGRLSDMKIQGAGYGSPIPVVFGRYRLAGSVIWATDIRDVKARRSGGKGKPKYIDHSYFVSMAVLVSKGEVVRFRRIWADADVIYEDMPEKSGYSGPTVPSWLSLDNFVFHYGTANQPQDSLIAADRGPENTPAYRGRAYVTFEDLPLHKLGYHIPSLSFEFETVDGGITTVQAVMEGIADLVKLPSTSYDFSALASIPCRGFVLNQRAAARTLAEPLQGTYFFDLVSVDYKIKGVPRGGAAVLTIDADHLGAGTPTPMDMRTTLTRRQQVEIPRQIDISYISAALDYNTFTQSAINEASPSTQPQLMQVPGVLTENEAATVATVQVQLGEIERTGYAFTLPWRYMRLAPADLVNLPTDYGNALVRITEITQGLFGHLEFMAVEDDPDIYSQSVVGAVAVANPATVDGADQERFMVAEINALVDEDADAVGAYVVASGTGRPWPGARVTSDPNTKLAGGQSVETVTEHQIDGTVGVLFTDLPAYTGGNVFDRTTTFQVRVLRGDPPVSVAEIDVLNGANALVCGEEILQYSTSVDLGSGVYELSGLLRGRRGTEYAAATAKIAGRPFVLVENDTAERFDVAQSELGRSHKYELFENGKEYDTSHGNTHNVGSVPQSDGPATITVNALPHPIPAFYQVEFSGVSVFLTQGAAAGATTLHVADVPQAIPNGTNAFVFNDYFPAVQSQTVVFKGNSRKPYSPVHVVGSRDGSQNLTIDWVRRARKDAEWEDGGDVPLDEASEAYSVDVYTNGSYTTVKRTLNVTAPTAAYSAAQQTTDFGSPQATVYAIVYQVGAVVGRGHGARVAV